MAAALIFILGEAAHAEPIMTVPGRDISVSFLEHCILETDMAVCLSWEGPAAKHVSGAWGRDASGRGDAFQPTCAGLASIPLHEMSATLADGGGGRGTMALLIMGGLLISLSNVIRQYAKKQGAPLAERSGQSKPLHGSETVSARI